MDFLRDLETGPNPPEVVYAVIESPKGTENKYEYDVKKKAIVLDRVLFSAVHFPGDYGFLPRTLDEDGDPLDILVLVTNPTFPGCIMSARPLGLLRMLDGNKKDDKILAVPTGDPRYAEYHDLDSLPEHILKEIAYLFETYKVLEGKQVKVLGWENSEAARKVIEHCQELYLKSLKQV
ncbi:MAG: inorganic diphosphatase [Candidatus Bathyarchaeia archaeon]